MRLQRRGRRPKCQRQVDGCFLHLVFPMAPNEDMMLKTSGGSAKTIGGVASPSRLQRSGNVWPFSAILGSRQQNTTPVSLGCPTWRAALFPSWISRNVGSEIYVASIPIKDVSVYQVPSNCFLLVFPVGSDAWRVE